MVGYIYKTVNLITNKVYIGKHKSCFYDKNYFGSGRFILEDISKYGIQNFSNEIIYEASSIDDLNEHEKIYIAEYRKNLGFDMVYNVANGGDGGDTFSNLPQVDKDIFVQKMTEINKERCNSEEFKKNKSEYMHNKYKDQSERDKQAENMNRFWNDEEKRKEQSEKLKEFYSNHPNYLSNEHKVKHCFLEFNNKKLKFESIQELREYLKSNYGYIPDNRTLKKMFEDGAMGIPRTFFHSKFKHLNGLLVYLEDNE